MKGAPRSVQFDDIYFSDLNGLEETRYVFLESNNLPEAWSGLDDFTIVETGFGTGLNFLSAWKLFEETSEPSQTLDFVSVEKYPLTPAEIREILDPWADFFEGRIETMLAQYPIRIAGFHRIKINSKITLTLIFDDMSYALPKLKARVDCWFLDGFTPAKNPEMWSDALFQQMVRLSHDGTTYATFTAARAVCDGLKSVGFSVQKKKGFGYKSTMISGAYSGEKDQLNKPLKRGSKIAIIGGGLAGTSCAYVLKKYGYIPVIYEAGYHLASGASGNAIGIYNPRFSKLRDVLSDFFAPAYAHLVRVVKLAGSGVDYSPCGSLHLIEEGSKEERLKSMAKHWFWHEDHARIVNAEKASEIAGIKLESEALYLSDSGYVSPQKLCEYYACDVEVHLNSKVENLSDIDADAIILASGGAVKSFDCLQWLPMETVRGQVSFLKETSQSKALKCNLCYGGYMSPARDNVHAAGATFEKWAQHTDVTQENHDANIKSVQDNIKAFESENFIADSGRAGLRAATNDRFPVVGAVPNQKHIYVSTAFGSHGLVSSIAAAHLIADILRCGACSLPLETVRALSPYRFVERAAKKGRILV